MKKLILILIFIASIGYSQSLKVTTGLTIGSNSIGLSTAKILTSPYDTSSIRYFASMTVQLPDSVKKSIDTLIRYLKATYVMSYSDTTVASDTTLWNRWSCIQLYCLNDTTNALIDMKGNQNGNRYGNPTFTAWKGFNASSNNCINTNYNAYAKGLTVSGGSLMLYSTTSNSYYTDIYTYQSNTYLVLYSFYGANGTGTDWGSIGYATSGATTNTGISWASKKYGTNNCLLYKDNSYLSQRSEVTQASSLPNIPIYIGASNNNGTLSLFTTNQYALFGIGGYLPSKSIRDNNEAFKKFFKYVGAMGY